MSSKTSIETFFYIGLDKLSLYVFEGINKNIFTKELLINPKEENHNIDVLIDNFLGKNIIQVEKKIDRFINELNPIISHQNFILIQASIKKNGKGDRSGFLGSDCCSDSSSSYYAAHSAVREGSDL